GTALLMLPLAYSLGTIINGIALWLLFRHDFMDKKEPMIEKTFFQSFSSAFFMGAVAYFFLGTFGDAFDLNRFWGIFFQGFLSGILGITAGVLLLKLFKNEELEDILSTLKRKIWRVKVISPGQQEL